VSDVRERRTWNPWVIRTLLLLVAILAGVVLFRLAGRIDWPAVWKAVWHLSWWQPFLLVAVLLVRQVLNALPLALYIPGVSVTQATMNDQGAILFSTIAPPPSDLALRVAMFNSWGVPTAKGLAGTVLNTLTFYIVRFSAPAVGFVLLAAVGQRPGLRYVEVLSILIAVTILVGLLLVVRSDGLARRAGSGAGRVVRRLRSTVDPEAWADACQAFRRDVAERFRWGFPRSLLGLAGMLVADLAMLVMCVRFVGVGSAELSLGALAIAYLFAYPFTLSPLQGLGIVDGLIVVSVADGLTDEAEAGLIGALMVWRLFTICGPLLLGALSVAWWRRPGGAGENADPRGALEKPGPVVEGPVVEASVGGAGAAGPLVTDAGAQAVHEPGLGDDAEQGQAEVEDVPPPVVADGLGRGGVAELTGIEDPEDHHQA